MSSFLVTRCGTVDLAFLDLVTLLKSMAMDRERREACAGHVFAAVGAISFLLYLLNGFAVKDFINGMTRLIVKFAL